MKAYANRPSLFLLTIPILYLITMARSPVLGDPTEYTFVARVLGIAHPPGYAFMALAGRLFQTLIAFGNVAWRTHLLAVTAGTVGALLVYSTVKTIGQAGQISEKPGRSAAATAALFAALIVATAADFWQHAIHANPHIVTAAFLAANLFFLTKWYSSRPPVPSPQPPANRWLYAFCFSAGLGITHHPLTVFSFPAYALFILLTRPGLWRDGRTIIRMVGCALLGLSIWLYFPIGSAMQPPFGPHDMNTLDGFLNVVLARGLQGNLFYYGPADQPDRALVFWSLLRLQYTLPTIMLALIGIGWLFRPGVSSLNGQAAGRLRPLLVLYTLVLLFNYGFVINTVQDVMAYLLGPFLVIGLLAGIGLYALIFNGFHTPGGVLLAAVFFLFGPARQVVNNLPHISLSDYDEGHAYMEAVFDWFDDRGETAVLLNDWEHMTPLWYAQFVEGRWPDPADVRPQFVSTARPWVESVFDFLPGGPVYLSGYRREVVEAGFRLRPSGPFYQVVEPGDTSVPADLSQVTAAAGDIEIIGYALPEEAVQAGDFVPFVLAMRAPAGTADYYAPILRVGSLTLRFTTDSHLITPNWQPGEVIVERFDFALPHHLAEGEYEVLLGMANLSAGEDTGLALRLGDLDVNGRNNPPATDHLLANFRQRVGLAAATATSNGQRRAAPWNEPLTVRGGDVVHLVLAWESIAPTEQSYTVFVHLIDGANQLVAPPLDYTPLGGAAPTHLWIPKWLSGQRYLDPYRVEIPPGLPPGAYYLEVGLYEMTSGRRLHLADAAGNLAGDRYIVGSLLVEE